MLHKQQTRISSRRRVGWADRYLNRNRAAGSGPTAAITGHPARPGAGPAAIISIGPAGAGAGDPARSVAARASGRPARAHHRVLIHDLFDKNRPRQNADASGQLSQHDRTHN